MYFLQPQTLWWLAALPPAAALIVWLAWFLKQRFQAAYGERELLAMNSRTLPGWRYAAKAALAAAAAALLVLAIARPAVPNGKSRIPKGTLDVVAVVDVSRSMAAQDYKDKLPPLPQKNEPERSWSNEKMPKRTGGTRLDMVRHLIRGHLINSLQGNQLGVVTYAGEAFPQAFLTADGPALNWVLDRAMTMSSAPGEGSAMVKAFELALLLFEVDSPPEHERLIVLFSDGGCTDEVAKLDEMAKRCRELKVRLVVVALGKATPSPIPVSEMAEDDEFARGLFHNGKQFYEVDGEVEKTSLDANLLQGLARAADGKYIMLNNAEDFNLLDVSGGRTTTEVQGSAELFEYPLIAALLCMMLLSIFANEFRKRGVQ
ncbi:MAG: VWA domain-containing protein [Candidatus Obscuribacterales bacterium]|nr:VWA domain-containing protein [Candidatus Obscuribacterales bacterium]